MREVWSQAACWGHTYVLSISQQSLFVRYCWQSTSIWVKPSWILPDKPFICWIPLSTTHDASQRIDEPPSWCMPDSWFTKSWNGQCQLLFWITAFWVVCAISDKNWHRCLKYDPCQKAWEVHLSSVKLSKIANNFLKSSCFQWFSGFSFPFLPWLN